MLPVAEIVTPWIDQVVNAPLPYVYAGAAASVYLAIEAGRAETATEICADMLEIVERVQGEAAVERAREDLEPIRQHLATMYPHVVAILDPDTWPAARIH